MPTVPSSAPATATTRRRFLFHTAAGAAVLTTGVLGAPVVALMPAAGAQASSGLDDETFVSFTAPLELAAVLAYQAAIDGGSLNAGYRDLAQEFQSHHQDVADALAAMLASTATPPVAAEAFSSPIGDSIRSAGGQAGVLATMAKMEETLSATHLLALESIIDAVTAETVAQVLATEAQQATVLSRGGGADLATVTPDVAGTDSAVRAGDVVGAPPSKAKDGSAATNSGTATGAADSTSGQSGNKSAEGTAGSKGGGSSKASTGSNSGANGSNGKSGN